MMDDTNPFGSALRPLPGEASPAPVEERPGASPEGSLAAPGGGTVAAANADGPAGADARAAGRGGAVSPELSAALAKFHSCRWRATPDVGDYCTHRDVLPFAGKEGFVAESWCPECAFYKLRRTPKKRDYTY